MFDFWFGAALGFVGASMFMIGTFGVVALVMAVRRKDDDDDA